VKTDPISHALQWLRVTAGLAFFAVVGTMAVVRLLRHQISSMLMFVLVAGLVAVLVFSPTTVRDVFVTLFHTITGH